MSMQLAGLVLIASLVGAIPFGILAARLYGVDVRKVGSGNIGATNVKRAIESAGGPGMAWALAVFLLDMLKGLVPVLAARGVAPGEEVAWFAVGLAAVAGHCASPFLGFHGGKGIATSLGMVFGASPWAAAIGFASFIVLLAITRYVSLSSIVAVGISVVAGALFRDWTYFAVGIAMQAFVLYTHRANIARLRAGTEARFSWSRQKPATRSTPGDAKPAPMADAKPEPEAEVQR